MSVTLGLGWPPLVMEGQCLAQFVSSPHQTHSLNISVCLSSEINNHQLSVQVNAVLFTLYKVLA